MLTVRWKNNEYVLNPADGVELEAPACNTTLRVYPFSATPATPAPSPDAAPPQPSPDAAPTPSPPPVEDTSADVSSMTSAMSARLIPRLLHRRWCFSIAAEHAPAMDLYTFLHTNCAQFKFQTEKRNALEQRGFFHATRPCTYEEIRLGFNSHFTVRAASDSVDEFKMDSKHRVAGPWVAYVIRPPVRVIWPQGQYMLCEYCGRHMVHRPLRSPQNLKIAGRIFRVNRALCTRTQIRTIVYSYGDASYEGYAAYFYLFGVNFFVQIFMGKFYIALLDYEGMPYTHCLPSGDLVRSVREQIPPCCVDRAADIYGYAGFKV